MWQRLAAPTDDLYPYPAGHLPPPPVRPVRPCFFLALLQGDLNFTLSASSGKSVVPSQIDSDAK